MNLSTKGFILFLVVSQSLISCSGKQPNLEERNSTKIAYSDIQFCNNELNLFETSICKANSRLLVSINQIVILRNDTTLLFIDSNSQEDSLLLSNELKRSITSFGDILGVFQLQGDSLLLLCVRGFVLLNRHDIFDVVSLSDFATGNYFFVSPYSSDKAIASISDNLYLIIGGEWSYPLKRYPSDMRFVFQYNLDEKQGEILDFVNPDFGQDYEVLSSINLSVVENEVVVSYSSDSIIYKLDFNRESLRQLIIPNLKSDASSRLYEFYRGNLNDYSEFIRYSDIIKIDEDKFVRAGYLQKSGSKSLLDNDSNSLLFFEFFNQKMILVERIFSNKEINNFSSFSTSSNQIFLSIKCPLSGDSQTCFCFTGISFD